MLLLVIAAYGPDLWDQLYSPMKEFCRMHLSDGTGHALVAIVAGGITAVSLGGAMVRFVSHWKADVALMRQIRGRSTRNPLALSEAAVRAKLKSPVVGFDEKTPLVFCRGLIRPTVYVSTGLVEMLDDDELRVVLVHEGTHAARRDPVRVLAAKLIGGAAFFLPAARLLEERYLLSLEFAADRRAANASLPHLASALLKLLEAPTGSSLARSAVAFSPTEERIRRLTAAMDERPRPRGAFRGYCGVHALPGPVLWTLASGVAAAAVVGVAIEVATSLERCPPTIV